MWDENVMHGGSHGDHALEDELEPRLTPDRPRRATAEDMLRFEGYLGVTFAGRPRGLRA